MILWLTAPRFSGGLKRLLDNYIDTSKLPRREIRFACLTTSMLVYRTKTKQTWDENKRPIFETALNALISQYNPKLIVINDRAALGYITSKYISLALCRGGVHMYKKPDGSLLPCLVVDDIFKTRSTTTGSWILLQDLAKIKRWYYDQQRHEPRFAYTVCNSLPALQQFRIAADPKNCIAMACDIETSGRGRKAFITCSGYSIWSKTGQLHTWVVPFFDGGNRGAGNCAWPAEQDEIQAWETIRQVNANSVPKIFQNGSYDNTYFTRYRIPSVNWILDTLNLFHSIWPESRKTLDFISSLCIDHYTYWKDEGKEDAQDDVKGGAVPTTPLGMQNYWRYNALDCHNTLLSARFLLTVISQPHMAWAWSNYIKEIRRVTGPAFAMSMRGVHVNQTLKDRFYEKNISDSFQALETLRTMVDDPEFNPNSPIQVKNLIYSTLQAAPLPRKKQSTQEPILKVLQTQSPILDIVIEQIWKAKKPANNASKYGEKLWLWNSRWLYMMNGTGTETGRYASKSHNLWIGTQIQNPPYAIRTMVEPDPGFLLWRIDYAQSDAYFTAFESEDQNFINTMLSDKDTHCIHAEHFFKLPYKKLFHAHEAEEPWVSHNVTGVRSITKRIVYGANYLMAAYTLFMTMGHKAVVAAAKSLGFSDAATWDLKRLVQLCDAFLGSYFQFYPELKPWLQEEISRAKSNQNLVTCAFGMTRKFFGDMNDDATHRELASFFGQGGTAGNINQAIDTIYYGNPALGFPEPMDSQDLHILFQVHDDLTGQIREEKLHLIEEVDRRMKNVCHVKGREFIVPTEIQVGYGWGKRQMRYIPGKTTLADIKAHDQNWWKKQQ